MQLIINLLQTDYPAPQVENPWFSDQILDIEIPQINLPSTLKSHWEICVETIVRDYLLINQGYCAAQDFSARQQASLGHANP